MEALATIRKEHRSIAAVLHGMQYLVREVTERGAAPDFGVFGAMIYYLDTVPERFHHPKEDAYLFSRLRARCPEAMPLINRLQNEHAQGAQKIRTLEQALTRYQQGGKAEFAKFAAAVDDYVSFNWAHMRAEEEEVLPLAEKHFSAADWAAIDAAFAQHADPLAGTDTVTQPEALFRRIVNLAPPPIGVGAQSR
jgi:hemerythrin-like domain-containing protein